jgi:hypothetical protein
VEKFERQRKLPFWNGTDEMADHYDLPDVTRFEVTDARGRFYVRHNVEVRVAFQDDGRTMKVWVRKRYDGR